MPKNIQNNLVIELHVPDFNKTKEFYGSLGFQPISENLPDTGGPGYLVMRRNDEAGDTMLNFYGGDERVYNQSFFKQFPRDTIRGYEMEVTIPIKDIDVLYQQVVNKQKQFIQQELMDKQDRDWKWRDFRMTDPFGFYLRFTELLDWGQ